MVVSHTHTRTHARPHACPHARTVFQHWWTHTMSSMRANSINIIHGEEPHSSFSWVLYIHCPSHPPAKSHFTWFLRCHTPKRIHFLISRMPELKAPQIPHKYFTFHNMIISVASLFGQITWVFQHWCPHINKNSFGPIGIGIIMRGERPLAILIYSVHHWPSPAEPCRQAPVIFLPVKCAESKLFSHFLGASTEGGTTPT